MSIYKIYKCEYCGESNQIVRPTPFMADGSAMMCERCWDETKKEYAASTGEYIPEFESMKEDYNSIKKSLEANEIQRLYRHIKILIENNALECEFEVFAAENPNLDSIEELNDIIEEEISNWGE